MTKRIHTEALTGPSDNEPRPPWPLAPDDLGDGLLAQIELDERLAGSEVGTGLEWSTEAEWSQLLRLFAKLARNTTE